MFDKLSNESFKKISKYSLKKNRTDDSIVIIEGERIISQLLDYQLKNQNEPNYFSSKLLQILISEKKIDTYKNLISLLHNNYKDIKINTINHIQAKQLSDTVNSQNIFALIHFEIKSIDRFNKLLFLDNISDPGNLGTLIRTASAFDIDGIVLSKDCCEITNPKVIRASMGAVFIMKYLIAESDWILNRNEEIYVSDVNEGYSINSFSFPNKPYILIIGSEANGVNNELIPKKGIKINIPMKPDMESLNVSIAGGILMYKMYSDSININR